MEICLLTYLKVFGSLPYELTEGDILIIFSQYGIPVHLKLVRDKETGKSKGFGYLKYEDQRSTVLAVDNLNGTKILGRIIRVDHAYYEERDYDEEYEYLLQQELRNDFADKEEDEVEDKPPKSNPDDEFQDPLLLMQKEKADDFEHHSRGSHHGHRHRSGERRHRDRFREQHKESGHREHRRHDHRERDTSSRENKDHKDHRVHKAESGNHRRARDHHRHDRHHEKSDRKHRSSDADEREHSEKKPKTIDHSKSREDEEHKSYETTDDK